MEKGEYQKICELETTHWWYTSTHDLIATELRRLIGKGWVLDAGCGTGGLIKVLNKDFLTAGFDASRLAVPGILQNHNGPLLFALGRIEKTPFRDGQFDAVACIDVIYHHNVADEADALNEMHRVLKADGYIIVQVPAFECLRGGHDEAVEARRRYTLRELESLLAKCGFQTIRIRYRYPWLFFPAFIKRHLTRGTGRSDLKPVVSGVNSALQLLCRFFDNEVFQRIPFGTSVFAVGRKT
jgi:SAM-dependent methyltransferase